MRIPKISELLCVSVSPCLAVMLSIGAAAQASPAPATSQPSAAPGSTATAPQSPATSNPAPSNQAGPSSSSASSGQSSPASIDDELQLTPDQKQKIASVVDDENKQISAVRDDNSMTLEQKQQKVLAIRQAGTPRIKAILTPDQLQKLAAIQQRMREQQGTQAPAQNSAPQTSAPPSSSPQR